MLLLLVPTLDIIHLPLRLTLTRNFFKKIVGGGRGGAKRWLPGNNSKTVNSEKGDKNVVSHTKNNKDGYF